MRGRFSLFLMWTGVVLLLAVAQACAAGGRAPVKIVRVDLSSGVFEDWLPFDEPFVIKGAIPDTIDQVGVTCAATNSKPQDASQSQSIVWHRKELFPSDSFAVHMPALNHSTVYRFKFTFSVRLSDDELTRFRNRAFGIVDTVFRAVQGDGLSKEELRPLRDRLRAEVTPEGAVLAEQGFLAGGALDNALQMEPILSEQDDRELVLDELQETFEVLMEYLERAGHAGVASSILDSIRLVTRRKDMLAEIWIASEVRDGTLERARATVEEAPDRGGQAAAAIAGIDSLLANVSDNYKRLEGALADRSAAITKSADNLRFMAAEHIWVAGSTNGSFKTRTLWHVSQDLGLAWVPGLDDVLPFFGLNIYRRPINRDVPLGGFWTRFAFTVGITLQSVAKTGERENILGNGTPILGGGIRLTEFTRLSGGVVMFKANDPNPLVTDWDPVVEGYVALGMDIEFKDLIQRFGTVFN